MSSGNDAYEVKAEILKIIHPELGEIRGIITIGLDYLIYLSDGTVIIVNAEESPGKIYNSEYIVSKWSFDVQIHIVEKTGVTEIERQKTYNYNKQKELIRKYEALLGLSKADWESY